MYRIKIFSSFGDQKLCKGTFEHVFNSSIIDFYGENKKIVLTNEDNYTHAVLLNTAMPDLTIPKENVVGLAFEPYELLGLTPYFIEYAKKHIGTYLIGHKNQLPELFVEHYAFMWHNNPHREIIKNHCQTSMSIVLSNKKYAPGHKYRHELVNYIIKNDLPIDIYGTGSTEYNSTHVKGKFDGTEPYNDYLFSICIENFQSNDYISEKIIDPIMHNTVPIYLGAKNIMNYFKEVIVLNGDITHDMNLIESILKNPIQFYKKTYHEDNLKYINFFHHIDKFFHS